MDDMDDPLRVWWPYSMPHFPLRRDASVWFQSSPRFVLYQRDDCHLCDLALAVLAEARLQTFESVFIDEDPRLEARFGSRVPVLREDASGAELDWPFEAAEVVALYARASPTPG